MTFSPIVIFQRADRYEGVRPINIYLLRLLYVLMFFVLGKETWTHILTHQGAWDPTSAVSRANRANSRVRRTVPKHPPCTA